MPDFELAQVTTKYGSVVVTHSTSAVVLTVPVVPLELSAEQAEDVAEELKAAALALRAAQGKARQ